MPAVAQPADKLVGQVLADRYEILHRLGEGAMGVVYKARHVKVGRPFAVKVLHARALQDPKVAQRFAREAEAAGRLRHPNVIGVVDVGEIENTSYMVMDFAEGPDLAALLDEAPMRPERIVHLVRQMLEGLYHAHEHGLIHRDFKPENVIVERDAHGTEMPRIVDFGIALLQEAGDSSDGKGRLTTNGLVLGTPHYMAPEQAVADPIDHRIDLFALGIVIYEMLSGRLPFDGGGAEVARANLLLDPPPIKQRVPHLEVDPLLEAFARRLMAKRREARPATAKAARELLDLIERDRTAAATILGVPVARSGRTPAVTEPVTVDEPCGSTAIAATPAPAPGAGQPVAPPGPPVLGQVAAPPDDLAPPYSVPGDASPRAPMPPAPVYPRQLAQPMGDVRHGSARDRRSHRDTALGTPFGWQTASLPGRRRSWLIGGVAVGTACVIAAVILSFTGAGRNEAVPGQRRAPAGPAAAAMTPAPRPATGESRPVTEPGGAHEVLDGPSVPSKPDMAPPGPPEVSDTPGTGTADDVAAAAADPADRGGKPGGTAAGAKTRTPVVAPARVHVASRAPAGGAASSQPALEPRPSQRREPPAGAPDPERHDPGSIKSDAAHPVASAEIAPEVLGDLFKAVGKEIHNLPEDEQDDLMTQLRELHVMTAMQAEAPERARVHALLLQMRNEVRSRLAVHKGR